MPNRVGNRIKQLRKDLKLSQEALARRAGYNDRSVIAKFETGRSVPDAKLADLAAALETTPAYLLGTVRDTLASLGIMVSEDSFGNAELVDSKTGATRQYPKPIWVKLQEREDFRKIFHDLGTAQALSNFPNNARLERQLEERNPSHYNQKSLDELLPAEEKLVAALEKDEQFQQLFSELQDKQIVRSRDMDMELRDGVIHHGLIPAGTGLRTRYEHTIPPTGLAQTLYEQLHLDLFDPDFLKRLQQLTPEELTRVDAFVQGLLAARED